jgi:hypothetical protein
MIDRSLPAENAAGRIIKLKVMKKMTCISFAILIMILGSFKTSVAGKSAPLGIGITFCTKAYWDGETKSCVHCEKGCCFHIEFSTGGGAFAPGQIVGTLEIRSNNVVAFSFSRKNGALPETLRTLLKDGNFILDGDGTFSEDIIAKLGLPPHFKLVAGPYSYSENGDVIVVLFK